MKKLFLFFIFLSIGTSAHATLNVVATLPVLASLAAELGGDKVVVTSIARANQDPHFLDAKPSYVVQLNKADMLVHNGLELEIGWLSPILQQARNPNILAGKPGNVDTSQSLNILEVVPKADRSMGDVHPNGNPHTWLSPENAKLIAANICKHLIALDPDNAAFYKTNLEKFLTRLNAKLSLWQPLVDKLRDKNIMTYHKSFTYFADWVGLNVVGTMEPLPGIPPSSKHVDALLKQITAGGISAIVIEDYYPHKIPDYLKEKTGIPVLILPNTTGTADIDTYEQLISHLLMSMAKIL